MKMPLSIEEINEIRDILKREPTREELVMFEAHWSEHCSYKSSRRLLRLLPNRGSHVVLGPGRDAPAVEVFPGILAVFKIESHNHPSAVDPYNGAATGVGGIIRDILTLGAKPIALLDLLYMGNPFNPHANWLIRNIVKGISDYGNRVGVPVVAGDTWFDESFNKQPLVNVACLGIVEKNKAVLSKPRPGDLVVVIGNSTGRDGLLGSSFASAPLKDNMVEDIGAVQIGDALMEKILIDVVNEVVEKKLVNYIKDLGGGGLTTAISEAAGDNDLGVEIYLDRLHLRMDLEPYEILASESQERMLLAVPRENLNELTRILEKYEAPYSIIGVFNDSGLIRVYYKGRIVAEVPSKAMTRPRALVRKSKPPEDVLKGLTPIQGIPEPDLEDAIIRVFSSPNVVSRRWIYEQYDHEVGGRTVVKPGIGDAAVLKINDDGKGIAVKGDGNPRYTWLNPFNGAANVVSECYRNLVSVGSTPLAIVDEINAGNPEKPEHYWFFEKMLKGLAWISDELGIPVVGGKVSFYNEDSSGNQVKPTLTIVGIGRIDNVKKAKTMEFKEPGSYIVVIGETLPEIGGSEYLYRVHGLEAGEIPVPRPRLEYTHGSTVKTLINEDAVSSVHDVSIGGLATSILEMAVASGLGAEVELSLVPSRGIDRLDYLLFSETQARYIIEVPLNKVEKARRILDEMNVVYGIVGRVLSRSQVNLLVNGRKILELDTSVLGEIYADSLEKYLERG